MKKYLFLLVTVSFMGSMASAAESIVCSQDGSDGQGYQAVMTANKAELLVNGVKVADLTFAGSDEAEGGDQISVYHYSQRTVNGYELTLTSGGIVGMTTVTVSRGGFAGLTELAVLNTCR
jgi:hypothetical protein